MCVLGDKYSSEEEEDLPIRKASKLFISKKEAGIKLRWTNYQLEIGY